MNNITIPQIAEEMRANILAVRELERLFKQFSDVSQDSQRKFIEYEPKILFQMLSLKNCPIIARHYESRYKELQKRIEPKQDLDIAQRNKAFRGKYRAPTLRGCGIHKSGFAVDIPADIEIDAAYAAGILT